MKKKKKKLEQAVEVALTIKISLLTVVMKSFVRRDETNENKNKNSRKTETVKEAEKLMQITAN
jgi:hypothetical protein